MKSKYQLDLMVIYLSVLGILSATVVLVLSVLVPGSIAGVSVSAENVLQAGESSGTTLLSVFSFALVKEMWVYVHFTVPFTIRMLLTDSNLVALFVCFVWEFVETMAFTLVRAVFVLLFGSDQYSFVSWFGETPQDSLIGDMCIGAVGILLASYVARNLHAEPHDYAKLVRRARGSVGSWVYVCALAGVVVFHLFGIVCISLPEAVPIMSANWLTHVGLVKESTQTVPVGHLFSAFFLLIGLRVLGMYDHSMLHSADRALAAASVIRYNAVCAVMTAAWIGTLVLFTSTYVNMLVVAALVALHTRLCRPRPQHDRKARPEAPGNI
jgi:hypothetical protein